MKRYIVYEHKFPNGKSYIGITSKAPNARWAKGKGYSESHQEVMYKAIQKYGWENISHFILYEDLSLEEAQRKEIELIKEKRTYIHAPLSRGYNMTLGGEGCLGHKSSRKVKETNRKRLLGKRGKFCCNSCPVICNNEEFESITDFCEKNNFTRGTVEKWLNGKSCMPKEWFDKNLRYKNKPDTKIKKPQERPFKNELYYCQRNFRSQRELAEYLGISPSLLCKWLKGEGGVPKEIYYNGIYKKTGEKYNLKLIDKPSKTKVLCDGKIFNSQRELATYLNIKPATLNAYLVGKNKFPDKLKNKNIRYIK